jgi:transcriptional regulator with XRE-family HTH domain
MGKAIGGLPEATALAASAAERRAQRGDAASVDEPRNEGPASEADLEASFALGSWLARQRELRGISREELAALTRLPMRSLERLETGAFDGQQDGFVRGFVRTVALAIGLDPDDAVARLLAEPAALAARRGLDLRRVAVAAIGVAGLIALFAALVEWAQAPAEAPGVPEYAPILRRDPVRALAIERGLLSEGESLGESQGALQFEPAPPEPPLEAEAGTAPADPPAAN